MFDNIRIVNLLRNSCFLVIDNDEFESYLFIYLLEYCKDVWVLWHTKWSCVACKFCRRKYISDLDVFINKD